MLTARATPNSAEWFVTHLPHQGAMCLLEELLDWDARRLRAASRLHRTLAHPLRAHGRLGAACGIEFAAQAMAAHGALLAPAGTEVAGAGVLVSLRSVKLEVTRLDDIEEDLVASVERVSGDDSTVLYDFSVTAGSASDARRLLAGRATVMLRLPTPAPGAS